jgi:arginine:ornithine antiporter/lysine permease
MALIPFLFVAAYGLQLTRRGETYDIRPGERRRDLIFAALATAYTIFLLYAGGLKFIVLSAVLYAPGTALYFWARREQGKPALTKTSDWVILGLAVVGAIVGIYWLATGYIKI